MMLSMTSKHNAIIVTITLMIKLIKSTIDLIPLLHRNWYIKLLKSSVMKITADSTFLTTIIVNINTSIPLLNTLLILKMKIMMDMHPLTVNVSLVQFHVLLDIFLINHIKFLIIFHILFKIKIFLIMMEHKEQEINTNLNIITTDNRTLNNLVSGVISG